MWHVGRTILVSLAAVVLAVPAIAADEDPPISKPSALVGSSLAWCPEVPEVKADPSLYRDRPIYLWNPPTDELRRWAEQRPGYVDMWIDRDNLGWIVVAFTQGADKRQAAIERRFPDLGAVAVEVEHSKQELKQVRRRIERDVAPLLEFHDLWIQTNHSFVVLDVDILTDEIVALLEPLIGDDPVCVEGRDPAWLTPDGPQPTEGDGWALVGQRQGSDGPYFRTGLASDREQLEALWSGAGMEGGAPDVDLIENVVIWFAKGHDPSCGPRLDDVVIDHDRALIHPDIVTPGDPRGCRKILFASGDYQYLVAVERERLPAAPFAIQLGPDHSGEDRVVVETDLRAPGSVADDDEIARRLPPEQPRTPLRSGGTVEVGERWPFVMDVRCGVGYFGELNDVHWVRDKSGVPEAWQKEVSEDGEILVSVVLKGGKDPRAKARTAGQTIRYEPRRDAPSSACDD